VTGDNGRDQSVHTHPGKYGAFQTHKQTPVREREEEAPVFQFRNRIHVTTSISTIINTTMDFFGGANRDEVILIDDSDEYDAAPEEDKWASAVHDVNDQIAAVLDRASRESSVWRERSEERLRREESEEQLRRARYSEAAHEEERRRRLKLPSIPITPQHEIEFARTSWSISPTSVGRPERAENWTDTDTDEAHSEESQVSPKRQCTSHPRDISGNLIARPSAELSHLYVYTEEDLQRFRDHYAQPDPTQRPAKPTQAPPQPQTTTSMSPQKTSPAF
jgi:hypothetical protein